MLQVFWRYSVGRCRYEERTPPWLALHIIWVYVDTRLTFQEGKFLVDARGVCHADKL